jgi:hypothetical protein
LEFLKINITFIICCILIFVFTENFSLKSETPSLKTESHRLRTEAKSLNIESASL